MTAVSLSGNYALEADDNITTQAECEADDGIWHAGNDNCYVENDKDQTDCLDTDIWDDVVSDKCVEINPTAVSGTGPIQVVVSTTPTYVSGFPISTVSTIDISDPLVAVVVTAPAAADLVYNGEAKLPVSITVAGDALEDDEVEITYSGTGTTGTPAVPSEVGAVNVIITAKAASTVYTGGKVRTITGAYAITAKSPAQTVDYTFTKATAAMKIADFATWALPTLTPVDNRSSLDAAAVFTYTINDTGARTTKPGAALLDDGYQIKVNLTFPTAVGNWGVNTTAVEVANFTLDESALPSLASVAVSVTGTTSAKYTGSPITATEITVAGTAVPLPDAKYAVGSYTNNTGAGTASVTVAATGTNGTYQDQSSKVVNFTIGKADLVAADFTGFTNYTTANQPNEATFKAGIDFVASRFAGATPVRTGEGTIGVVTVRDTAGTGAGGTGAVSVWPLVAGGYDVFVTTTGGDNFAANVTPLNIGRFTVSDVVAFNINALDSNALPEASIATFTKRDTTLTYRQTTTIPKPKPASGKGSIVGLQYYILDNSNQLFFDTLPTTNAAAWVSNGTWLVGGKGQNPVPASGLGLVVDHSPYTVYALMTSNVGSGANLQRSKTVVEVGKIRVNKKALDASMIRIPALGPDGPWTYTGVSQQPGLNTVSVIKDSVASTNVLTLVAGTDYIIETTDARNTDAGTGTLRISAQSIAGGNYTGVAVKEFTIAKKAITVDKWLSTVANKYYDGTATAVDSLFALNFEGLVNSEVLTAADYTVTAGKFLDKGTTVDSKNAGEDKDVSGTVAIKSTSTVGKNYVLTSASFTLPLAGKIDPVTLTTANAEDYFTFTEPTDRWFNNNRQPVGAVTYKTGVNNGVAPTTAAPQFAVVYTYGSGANNPALPTPTKADPDSVWSGDTTYAPTKAGEYPVSIKILDKGTNFANGDSTKFKLYDYTIGEPETASLKVDANGDTVGVGIRNWTTRKGVSVTLSLTGYESPNGGQLLYRWKTFKSSTYDATTNPGVTISGVTTSATSYKFSANQESTDEPFFIGAEIVNRVTGKQVDASTVVISEVTVLEAPKPLVTPKLTIDSSIAYVYNGSKQEPTKEEVLLETKDTDADEEKWDIIEGDNFGLTSSNSTNAGTATLRATASVTPVVTEDYDAGLAILGTYAGTVTKTYTIAQKTPDEYDFDNTKPMTHQYTPTAQGVAIVLEAPKTAAGTVTTYYSDGLAAKTTTIPVNVGAYEVTLNVAGGTNFKAGSDIFYGMYTITPKELEATDLVYDASLLSEIPDTEDSTWTPKGIGTVTVKPNVGTGYGAISVKYDGLDLEELPATYPANYSVTVVVAKGDTTGSDNFAEVVIDIGTYTVGIAEVARVIPVAPVVPEAAVTPLKKVAADFTVGPSPAKSGEVVKFFYSKAVKSGTIYVYNGTGKVAAKVAVKASAGGAIASVKAPAAGTYLAKGALVGKDGKREKVSFLFVVAQ